MEAKCGEIIFFFEIIDVILSSINRLRNSSVIFAGNSILKISHQKSSQNFDHIQLELKVIIKSKDGSLTMQPAKHDVTGMPLYRMYRPYPIPSSTLWLAIHTFVLHFNTISKIILKNFAKYREILAKVLRNSGAIILEK